LYRLNEFIGDTPFGDRKREVRGIRPLAIGEYGGNESYAMTMFGMDRVGGHNAPNEGPVLYEVTGAQPSDSRMLTSSVVCSLIGKNLFCLHVVFDESRSTLQELFLPWRRGASALIGRQELRTQRNVVRFPSAKHTSLIQVDKYVWEFKARPFRRTCGSQNHQLRSEGGAQV